MSLGIGKMDRLEPNSRIVRFWGNHYHCFDCDGAPVLKSDGRGTSNWFYKNKVRNWKRYRRTQYKPIPFTN